MVEASDLLESARVAGVQIFAEDGHIQAIHGQWWMQDIIDALWERELEIAALLAVTPSIFRLVRQVIHEMPNFLN